MTELGTELPAKSMRRKERDPYSRPNVLRTELKEDSIRVLEKIREYIGPTNPIDEMYVDDAAHYTWQVMRYRRIETGIWNNALSTALVRVLNQIQFPPTVNGAWTLKKYSAAEQSAYDWLFDKGRVSALLEEAGLDESAIEAEAFRRVADDLEKARRMLMSAEDSRDKAFRRIAKSRKNGFADQLRRASDRVIAEDQVPSIAIGGEN
jgi:hypothetical protein